MDNEEPKSIWRKFYESLINGNPLYLMMGLFLAALLFSLWVWQTVNGPPVYMTPNSPEFSHPTIISPVQVLTERAKQLTPDTSPLVTPTPQIIPTLDGTQTPQPWDG